MKVLYYILYWFKHPSETHTKFSFYKNNRSFLYAKWCWRVGIKWPKMKWPKIRTMGLPGSKKSENFLSKLVNSYLLLIDMEHDLNLTLKMYKSAFSDKQIIEIKKKMHIDPIFTYSDSEIALKVCRNKQRIKFNCRPLCGSK